MTDETPGTPEVVQLTSEERRDALIMVRFAVEARWRRLRWSLPNDASWPTPFLGNVPVRYDNLGTGHYDLTGTRPFGARCAICGIVRHSNGYEVWGIPGEEWLRPPVLPGEALASSHPVRRRLVATTAALIVPAAAFGGFTLIGVDPTSGGGDPDVVAAQASPAPALGQGGQLDGSAWVRELEVRLASVNGELEEVREAEAAWAALPGVYDTVKPAAVEELEECRVALKQLKATLETDLATWQEAREARAELAEAERRLVEVRRAAALDGTTQVGERLSAAERRLAQEVEERRARVEDLTQVATTVTKTPLPEPVDATPVVRQVKNLAENPPPPPRPDNPDVLANGREFDTPRAEVPDDHEPEPPDPPDRPQSPRPPEPDGPDESSPPVRVAATYDDGLEVQSGPVKISTGGNGGSPDVSVSSGGSEPDPALQPESEKLKPASIQQEVDPEPESDAPARRSESAPELEPKPEPAPQPEPDPEPVHDAPASIGEVDYEAEFERGFADLSSAEKAQFDRDVAEFNAQLEWDVDAVLTDLDDGDIDDPAPPGVGWPSR